MRKKSKIKIKTGETMHCGQNKEKNEEKYEEKPEEKSEALMIEIKIIGKPKKRGRIIIDTKNFEN